MAGNSLRGKSQREINRSLAKGLKEYFGTNKIQVGNVEYDGITLGQKFDEADQHYVNVDGAKGTLARLVAIKNTSMVSMRSLARQTIAFLESAYGGDPEALGKYGLSPTKSPRPLTAEERMSAVTKARATRKMRGTLGKRQKANVKAQGTVTVSASLNGTTPPASGTSSGASNGATDGAASGTAATRNTVRVDGS